MEDCKIGSTNNPQSGALTVQEFVILKKNTPKKC